MTLLAVVSFAVTFRLGIWQLDRLAQRRATSAQLVRRIDLPVIPITAAPISQMSPIVGLPADIGPDEAVFRSATAQGVFDYSQEVAVTNQIWEGKLGFHLLTPLVLDGGTQAVLVDRGWIPVESASPAAWAQYRPAVSGPPLGASGAARTPGAQRITITGWIRQFRRGWPRERFSSPGMGVTPGTGREPDRLIPAFDAAIIQPRVAYVLLPVIVALLPEPPVLAPGAVVSATPNPTSAMLPYRRTPVTDLGDGVHLIAAAQWFIISGIIVVGYVIYLRRHAYR